MAPPPKNAAEIEARNCVAMYRLGWKDAMRGRHRSVASRFPNPVSSPGMVVYAAYMMGFADATGAQEAAFRAADERYGIDVATEVLR